MSASLERNLMDKWTTRQTHILQYSLSSCKALLPMGHRPGCVLSGTGTGKACIGGTHTYGIIREFPSLDVPIQASTDNQLEDVHILDICQALQVATPGNQKGWGNQRNGLAIHNL